MRPSITENVDREAQLKNAYIMRKQEQKDNKDAYERALEDMKEVVYNDEGPDMKRELEGERTEWLADAIFEEDTTGIKPADLAAEGKVQRERGGKKKAGERGLMPESMQEFYDDKYPEPVEEEPEADPKADKGKAKDDKGKKGKKDEPEEEELPLLQEKRDLTTKMFQTTEHYQNEWEDFNEEDNFAQKHDVELVKNEIRDGVKLQIRDEVDEMFRDQLKKLKQELGQNFAKPPKAKKIKPSKKNAKGEKIKFKKLTGDKNKEIAGRSVEETLVKLVDHGLVNSYKPRKISDLIGDFNYLGTVRQSCEPAQGEEWQPADPSMQQLRAAITEYCVLPLGSQRVATAMRGDQHGDVPDSRMSLLDLFCYTVPRVAARRPWSRPSLMSSVPYSSTSPPPRSRASSEKIRRLPRRSLTSSARSRRTRLFRQSSSTWTTRTSTWSGKNSTRPVPGGSARSSRTTRRVFSREKRTAAPSRPRSKKARSRARPTTRIAPMARSTLASYLSGVPQNRVRPTRNKRSSSSTGCCTSPTPTTRRATCSGSRPSRSS